MTTPSTIPTSATRLARTRTAAFIAATLASFSLLLGADFYVSPSGNDSNSGTSVSQPFRSLERARNAVRQRLSSGQVNHTVHLRGGTYALNRTLVFDLNDSTSGEVVYRAYNNENPVLSGGVQITGWSKPSGNIAGLPSSAQGNVWVADLPGALRDVKTLYRGDNRLPRARSRNMWTPEFIARHGRPAIENVGQKINPSDNVHPRSTIYIDKSLVRRWSNLRDIELLSRSINWSENGYLTLREVNMERSLANFSQHGIYKLEPWNRGYGGTTNQPYAHFENAIDFIDQPNEWCVNTQTNKVYLYSTTRPSNIIGSRLQELIRVQGNTRKAQATDVPVRGLTFRNLTFKYARRDNHGFDDVSIQHHWDYFDKPNAMIRFRGAERCAVIGCEFIASGANAIRFDYHAINNRVVDNQIHHMGRAAILFFGYGAGTKDVNKRNLVLNNHIHHCGELFAHAQMIVLSQSGENHVAHNYIHDVPRKAICLTGPRIPFFNPNRKDPEWSGEMRFDEMNADDLSYRHLQQIRPDRDIHHYYDRPERLLKYLHTRGNIVEYNEVARVLTKLNDGAAINTSGVGVNNIIRNNFVYGNRLNSLRTDDNSWDTLWLENVCVGIQWIAKTENYWVNNFMIDTTPKFTAKWGLFLKSRFQRNIIANLNLRNRNLPLAAERRYYNISDYDSGYGNFQSLATSRFDDNLYFHHATNASNRVDVTNQKLRDRGLDTRSVYANPLFVDPRNDDFRLAPNSPARALGIRSIDVRTMGLLPRFPRRFHQHLPQGERPDATNTFQQIANRAQESNRLIQIYGRNGKVRLDREQEANAAPQISFSAPNANQEFVRGTSIGVRAMASDRDGSVAGVTLFINGQRVRNATVSPFQWGAFAPAQADTPLRNLAVGQYTLRAVARDNDGASSEAQRTFRVVAPPNQRPAVSFDSPRDRQQFVLGEVPGVQAQASDPDGSIRNVTLFVGDRQVRVTGTRPFRWGSLAPGQADAPLANLTVGLHQLRLVARDNDGATREARRTIEIVNPPNRPPNVWFSRPASNFEYTLGQVPGIQAGARDPDGSVQGVSLFVNGTFVRFATVSPFQWGALVPNQADAPLRNLPVGTYTLRLVARDNDGATREATRTIRVVPPANRPPTATFTTPSNGQVFYTGQKIGVSALASDPDGNVEGVMLAVNGENVRFATVSPYQWGALVPNQSDAPLASLPVGTHRLTISAQDDDKALGETTIQIRVEAPPNEKPQVAILQPSQGQEFFVDGSIGVRATASDKDGSIRTVGLFFNDQVVRYTGVSPYRWGASAPEQPDTLLNNLTVGTHTIRVRAIDNDGAIQESEVRVVVKERPNQAPNLTVRGLAQDATLETGSSLGLTASATDPDEGDSIENVALFLNGTLIREEAYAPYVWGTANSAQADPALRNLENGSYTIRVVATDSNGATAVVTRRFTVETSLPEYWQKIDIGREVRESEFLFDRTTYELRNVRSHDISLRYDSFSFAYRGVEDADALLVARISPLVSQQPNAKAGLMYRSTTGVQPSNCFFGITAQNGMVLQHRRGAGNVTEIQRFPEVTAPVWVKLYRRGKFVFPSFSKDGREWRRLDPVKVPLGNYFYAGLAASSFKPEDPLTARFTNVQNQPLQQGYRGWALANFGEQLEAAPHLSGAHANADGDSQSNLMEYIVQGDPNGNDDSHLRSRSRFDGQQFTIELREYASLEGVDRQFEFSDSLRFDTWTTLEPLSVTVTPIEDDQFNRVEAVFDLKQGETPKRFHRVKYTLLEE